MVISISYNVCKLKDIVSSITERKNMTEGKIPDYSEKEDTKVVESLLALAMKSYEKKRSKPLDWIKYATIFTLKRNKLKEWAEHPDGRISINAQKLLNMFEPDEEK
jgi:hypothetical protein